MTTRLAGSRIAFPVEGLGDGSIWLRLACDADIPDLVAACGDPLIQRYTTVPANYAPEHARNWVARGTTGAVAGSELQLVIVRERDARLAGAVGLHEINRLVARCQAGYWVAPWARGEGVARRALGLLCDFGFAELGLERIEVTVERSNFASIQVALACGFAEEGLLRSYMPIRGVRRDMLMLSLLAAEGPRSPASGELPS